MLPSFLLGIIVSLLEKEIPLMHMNSAAEALYKEKLMTPEMAAGMVKSGDRVYAGTASSFAYALLDALWERRHELENVVIMGSMGYQKCPIYDETVDNPFLFNTFFMGVNERKQQKAGKHVTYNSVHLSMVDDWAYDIAKPDVCFFEVSKPDENGYMSFGPSGTATQGALAQVGKKIIVQVNSHTPYVLGEGNLIHVSHIDAIVEADRPYDDFVTMVPDDTSETIAKYILEEIPDGATFQLGLGNISTAIGYGLRHKNDLGIHTELLNDPMLALMESGNVTNKNKGYMDGKTVFSFTLGGRHLYETLERNEKFYVMPFRVANDARLIAKNRNMISINATMSVNLFGEAASDCVGWRQQSATGGQLDFVRGAQWSEGGKSFIATASCFEKNGKLVSKIVPYFAPGTAVTTPRSDIQYVATEYGCVNLKKLTAEDRAKALISIAHPAFREELTAQAKEFGLI